MDPENDEFTAEELAAFEGGFNDGTPAPAPAADAPAPGPGEVEAPAGGEQAADGTAAPEDDLAGLPPRVRAMLEQFETLKQAAESVPTLEHRLRSAEGRVAALQKQVPAPPPPAPPKLEAVERIRRELPEVVDAMEEFFQSKQTPAAPAPAADDAPATLLNEAAPGWEQKVASPEFDAWVSRQTADYQNTVRSTTSEAEMLRAITRFEAEQELAAQRQALLRDQQAAAARLNTTRTNRAQAAVVPSGAARRAPSTQSDEALFEAAFHTGRFS